MPCLHHTLPPGSCRRRVDLVGAVSGVRNTRVFNVEVDLVLAVGTGTSAGLGVLGVLAIGLSVVLPAVGAKQVTQQQAVLSGICFGSPNSILRRLRLLHFCPVVGLGPTELLLLGLAVHADVTTLPGTHCIRIGRFKLFRI